MEGTYLKAVLLRIPSKHNLLSSSNSTSSAADTVTSLPLSLSPTLRSLHCMWKIVESWHLHPAEGNCVLDLRLCETGCQIGVTYLHREIETGGTGVTLLRRGEHKSSWCDRSESVPTLTRNQRKPDFNCCKYKVSLSFQPCHLLLFCRFSCSCSAVIGAALPPCPCVPAGLITIACVQNMAVGFTLLFPLQKPLLEEQRNSNSCSYSLGNDCLARNSSSPLSLLSLL